MSQAPTAPATDATAAAVAAAAADVLKRCVMVVAWLFVVIMVVLNTKKNLVDKE